MKKYTVSELRGNGHVNAEVYDASDVDARIAELEKALREAKRPHYSCEDPWYSCPKHPEGTANDFKGDECDCGADEFNAKIDSVLMDSVTK
jgi:hypothetical protein